MKTIILGTLLVSFTLLTGCASKIAQNTDTTYNIYTEDDNFKSKRVDYLGYGLGGARIGWLWGRRLWSYWIRRSNALA